MLTELADRVYVEDGYEGGNVGLVLTERGALLVDTPMLPPDARDWRHRLAQMGVEQVYGIVNTDYHPENALGNAVFEPVRTFGHVLAARPLAKQNATVIEQMAEEYRQRDPTLAEEIARIEMRLPEIEVDDRMTLHLGNRHPQILYMEGHTPASLGLYLPEERILFAGENVTNNVEPVMYQANTLAWLGTLQRIKAMEVDVIVPGEGKVCGLEVLDPLIAHITEMRARVLEHFRRGASRRETVDRIEIEERFLVPEEDAARIRRRRRENVERVYTEIRISERKS